MSLEMVTDTWCGHVIRFVKVNGDVYIEEE